MFVPVVVALAAVLMIAVERLWPGRELPSVRGWWTRVVVLDAVQVAVVFAFGLWLEPLLSGIRSWSAAGLGVVGGSLLGYLAITFVYYWWHRWRHEVPLLWRMLHQVHHSPARIEIVTSFYKHPLEILSNAVISTVLLYPLLGLTATQAAGAVLLAAVAELFYHWNVKTPAWVGFFIQRPEMHQLHHAAGHHSWNYGDLPLWDWLFGTLRNPADFEEPCGFREEEEQKLASMLLFRDIAAATEAAHETSAAMASRWFNAGRAWMTPRRRAMALVFVGALAMTGDALQLPMLTGLGIASGASPYPKVFTTRDGLEGFSSEFEVSWTEQGTAHRAVLDPKLYSQLEGPYNRRNPYGAALAGGPYLASSDTTRPMFEAVGAWSFCRPDGGLLSELGLAEHPEDVVITVTPRPGAPATKLPLVLEAPC